MMIILLMILTVNNRGQYFQSRDNDVEVNAIRASELDENISYVNEGDDEIEDAPTVHLWQELQDDHVSFCEFQYLKP